jgi:hypothetical protein
MSVWRKRRAGMLGNGQSPPSEEYDARLAVGNPGRHVLHGLAESLCRGMRLETCVPVSGMVHRKETTST